MQQRLMLQEVHEAKNNGDDLYDLPDAPRCGQQPDQIEDQKKIAADKSRGVNDIALPDRINARRSLCAARHAELKTRKSIASSGDNSGANGDRHAIALASA